jgi:hypothetical protein
VIPESGKAIYVHEHVHVNGGVLVDVNGVKNWKLGTQNPFYRFQHTVSGDIIFP